MSKKQAPPVVTETAFSCPHCGAYTSQHWYKVFGGRYGEGHRTPVIPDAKFVERVKSDRNLPEEADLQHLDWAEKMALGKPFFEKSEKVPYTPLPKLENCNVSRCYNCREIAIWVHDQMVYPEARLNIEPNPDMPPHVRQLFDEARAIVGGSPKGAAALLRLCIQHLCIELGESGKNIDADIASLVAKDLNPLVQKALDVVRVIGNESVHPGEIDLNDNREVAVQLFGLVNLTCEQMISHPKSVEALYAELPESKRDGIDKRNARAKPRSDDSA